MIYRRLRIITGILALLVVAGALFARNELKKLGALEAYREWQQARVDEMEGEETSWLNLAGLFWLENGSYSFGGARENDFVIQGDGIPARIGRFIRDGEAVYFEPDASAEVMAGSAPLDARVQMQDDMGVESEDATVLAIGSLRWWIIARDGMLGVRVRDLDQKDWKSFTGIETFDYDHDWRLEAQFLPFEAPREVEYPTILGTTRIEAAPGLLVFQVAGQQFEVIPFERNEGRRLWLVFGDETNGSTTYAGGRFLYIDAPDETGRTVIDFNRAYNPPCAFSDYSTCPQPLRQNQLQIGIAAGEKVYRKG